MAYSNFLFIYITVYTFLAHYLFELINKVVFKSYNLSVHTLKIKIKINKGFSNCQKSNSHYPLLKNCIIHQGSEIKENKTYFNNLMIQVPYLL